MNGRTGTYTVYGAAESKVEVTWVEEYDISSNTSTITITQIRMASGWYSGGFRTGGTLSVDGKVIAAMDGNLNINGVYLPAQNSYGTIAGGPWQSDPVTHNGDGTKKVAIAFAFRFTSEGGTIKFDVSDSREVELTTIPRASTITVAPDPATIGQPLTIRISRATKEFSHRLSYSFGTVSGGLGAGAGESYTWTPPYELARAIKEASGNLTITCQTYQGAQEMGSTSQVITLIVPQDENTLPKGTMTLRPGGNLPPAFNGLYVVGKTSVIADFTATSEYSTIVAYRIWLENRLYQSGSTTQESAPLWASGTIVVAGAVDDERGFKWRTEQPITVYPYDKPRLSPAAGESSAVAARCRSDGTPDPAGTYLLIKGRKSYSPVNGVNGCEVAYRVKTDGGDYGPETVISLNADPAEVMEIIPDAVSSISTTYYVKVTVRDKIGEASEYVYAIPTAEVPLHLARGGLGFAVGKYAEQTRVAEFGWPIDMLGNPIRNVAAPTGDKDVVTLEFLRNELAKYMLK